MAQLRKYAGENIEQIRLPPGTSRNSVPAFQEVYSPFWKCKGFTIEMSH